MRIMKIILRLPFINSFDLLEGCVEEVLIGRFPNHCLWHARVEEFGGFHVISSIL